MPEPILTPEPEPPKPVAPVPPIQIEPPKEEVGQEVKPRRFPFQRKSSMNPGGASNS